MSSNRSMPPGIVIPVLGYADVPAAVAWLCAAFGFRERLRIGAHRVQLVIGGSPIDSGASIVVTDRPPASGASVMVRVPDVDAHHARAASHGAKIVSPPTDYPYGERQYSAVDLGGYNWTFSQSIADVDPVTWGGELIG